MIILYNPRAAESKARLPISVLSLAAVFEGRYKWRLVDGNVDRHADQTIADLLLADPNQFPVLPYEKANVPRYLGRTMLGSRTISYNSSQGCPFSCSFCAITKVYWARWLPEKAERTVATIRWLQQRYGING